MTCSTLIAQGTSKIRGTVIDQSSGLPIEMAQVYLAHTTLGATTDHLGIFIIENVSSGNYEMVIQHIAYEIRIIPLTAGDDEMWKSPIELLPKIYESGETTVRGEDDREWRKLIKQFTGAFIGKTDNASSCQILNPEVIDLYKESISGALVARSDSIIRIENRALGYHVTALLKQFNWYTKKDIGKFRILPFYREIIPQNENEAKIIKEQRYNAYRGSLRHFLSALINNDLEDQEFRIYRDIVFSLEDSTQNKESELLLKNLYIVPYLDSTGLYSLFFQANLKVDFLGNNVFRGERSYLKMMNELVILDKDGYLYDPMSLQTAGTMGKLRVADMLPFDYQPKDPD